MKKRIEKYLRQLAPHQNEREGAQLLRGAVEEIEHLRHTVAELSALAQHSDKCSWITPLPTGYGYWGCDCGLDHLVLDGEPTAAALTPNVQIEGLAATELGRSPESSKNHRPQSECISASPARMPG